MPTCESGAVSPTGQGGECSPRDRWRRGRGSGGVRDPHGGGGARRGAGMGGGREDPTLWPSWMPFRAVLLGNVHPKEYSTRLTWGIYERFAGPSGNLPNERSFQCLFRLSRLIFRPTVTFGKPRKLCTYKRALHHHRHRLWCPLGYPQRCHLNQSAHRCLYTLFHLYIHVHSSLHRGHRYSPS